MIRVLRVALGALFAAALLFQGPQASAQRAGAPVSANDTARYLAGLEPSPSSPLARLTREDAWLRYAPAQDLAWNRLDSGQLGRVRAWSARYMQSSSPLMLYLFSGPDFLYANAFFPNARTYVLSGLEAVGTLPNVGAMTRAERVAALEALAVPLGQIQKYSYFITKDMAQQLRASKLTGVMPLLYVFLARTGNRIDQVQYVRLAKDGGTRPLGPGAKGVNGVKIAFSGRDGVARELYYFRTDLSNGGLQKSGFRKFCRGLGRAGSLIKAASFLLHSKGFSVARELLMEQSDWLVQDDSGVPLRYFAPDVWALRPFGAYYGPIPMFAQYNQPEMEQLFTQGRPVPLEFGIGYRWPPKDSNVLLARRHSVPAPRVVETPRQRRERVRQERRERRSRGR